MVTDGRDAGLEPVMSWEIVNMSGPRVLARSSAVAVVMLLVAAVVGSSAASAAPPSITVKGALYCENGQPLQGVWVESTGGGSRWGTVSVGGTAAAGTYSAVVRAGRIKLHVGCGKNPDGTWLSNNRTPYQAVSKSSMLSAACIEAAGPAAERCSWWGATTFVAMPFQGAVDRFRVSTPGSHELYSAEGDWSTDIYGLTDKNGRLIPAAVRPRIISPMLSVPTTLRINRVWTGAAGKGVVVDVFRGNTRIGSVSYAHLDRVPAFRPGQVINTSTVLGYLRQWTFVPGVWMVDHPSEVHTHIEVGTVGAPRACAHPQSTATKRDGRVIGKIRPGVNATC